jgi:hypothetical protein
MNYFLIANLRQLHKYPLKSESIRVFLLQFGKITVPDIYYIMG